MGKFNWFRKTDKNDKTVSPEQPDSSASQWEPATPADAAAPAPDAAVSSAADGDGGYGADAAQAAGASYYDHAGFSSSENDRAEDHHEPDIFSAGSEGSEADPFGAKSGSGFGESGAGESDPFGAKSESEAAVSDETAVFDAKSGSEEGVPDVSDPFGVKSESEAAGSAGTDPFGVKSEGEAAASDGTDPFGVKSEGEAAASDGTDPFGVKSEGEAADSAGTDPFGVKSESEAADSAGTGQFGVKSESEAAASDGTDPSGLKNDAASGAFEGRSSSGEIPNRSMNVDDNMMPGDRTGDSSNTSMNVDANAGNTAQTGTDSAAEYGPEGAAQTGGPAGPIPPAGGPEGPNGPDQSGIPYSKRPHDYDVDEPMYDTQTGELLNKPKKKIPGILLTMAVTAFSVGAFVYAVKPDMLPSESAGKENDLTETEVQLALAGPDGESEAQDATEKEPLTEAVSAAGVAGTEAKTAGEEADTEGEAAEKTAEKTADTETALAIKKEEADTEQAPAAGKETDIEEKAGEKEEADTEKAAGEKAEADTEEKAGKKEEADTEEKVSEKQQAGVSGKDADKEKAGAEAEAGTEEKASESESETEQEQIVLPGLPDFPSDGVALSASLDVADMVEEVMPGIVSVTCTSVQTVEDFFYGRREMSQTDAGSGIIAGEDDECLYIVSDAGTAYGASDVTVGFSVVKGKSEGIEDTDTFCSAQIMDLDPETGLVMLSVAKDEVNETVLSLIHTAALGDSDQIRVGQRAIAIGNAMGCGQSVTEGIISAVGREMSTRYGTHAFIQTDASINYGNYGGALLNEDGEVIGINIGKITEDAGEGMGYALPVNDAKAAIAGMIGEEKMAGLPAGADTGEKDAAADDSEKKAADKEDAADDSVEKAAEEKDTAEDSKGGEKEKAETEKKEIFLAIASDDESGDASEEDAAEETAGEQEEDGAEDDAEASGEKADDTADAEKADDTADAEKADDAADPDEGADDADTADAAETEKKEDADSADEKETAGEQEQTEGISALKENGDGKEDASSGGKLGVQVGEITGEYQIIYRIPKGVYISSVMVGSGAQTAGLREGDIIVAVNDEPTETVAALQGVLSGTKPGDKVRISYVRPNEEDRYDEDDVRIVTVTLQ